MKSYEYFYTNIRYLVYYNSINIKWVINGKGSQNKAFKLKLIYGDCIEII